MKDLWLSIVERWRNAATLEVSEEDARGYLASFYFFSTDRFIDPSIAPLKNEIGFDSFSNCRIIMKKEHNERSRENVA